MHELSLVPTHIPANPPSTPAAEEMWQVLGHSGSLAYEPWPEADESLLVQNTYNLPVQVGARAGPLVSAVGGRLAPTRCGPCCSKARFSRCSPARPPPRATPPMHPMHAPFFHSRSTARCAARLRWRWTSRKTAQSRRPAPSPRSPSSWRGRTSRRSFLCQVRGMGRGGGQSRRAIARSAALPCVLLHDSRVVSRAPCGSAVGRPTCASCHDVCIHQPSLPIRARCRQDSQPDCARQVRRRRSAPQCACGSTPALSNW